jgi:hypothetical protein
MLGEKYLKIKNLHFDEHALKDFQQKQSHSSSLSISMNHHWHAWVLW